MAWYGSDDAKPVLVSGYDLQSNTLEWSENVEAVMEETHVLGDAWVASMPVGLRKGEWHMSGFYDDSTGSGSDRTVAALVGSSGSTGGNIGSTFILTYGVEGGTVGTRFTGAAGVNGKVTRTPSRGVLTKIAADFGVTGQVDTNGKIIKALGASTGSTANSHAAAVDHGSSSTKGGRAYYHIVALNLDGNSSVQTWVRHSDDSTTWVDLTTFTGSTTAPYAEVIESATNATIRRYLASAHAFATTAANTSVTITSFVGYSRNT